MINTMSSLLLLCLPLIFFTELTKSSPSPSPSQPKNIFILAGQSNMAGRGGVLNDKWDRVVPFECQPNPSILRLNAKLSWEEAREPLHADIDVNGVCGVGPGLAFANAVRQMDPSIGVIGLVPCAIGGTHISEWSRGRSLYHEFVKRSKASLQDGGTIRAILWYQGESDTVSRVDAESYRVKLEKFMLDLRSDFQSPMLPIIQVALASGQGSFVETVREAQLGLNISNVGCVDAKGLQLEPDYVHLTTNSQIQLGQMLAQEFIKTFQNPTALVRAISPTSNSHHSSCIMMRSVSILIGFLMLFI